MAGRLEGKVAVITGAASGIGRATVDLFVAEGAKVIAADIQEDKGAKIEFDHMDAHGGKAKFVRCDVMQEADIAAAVGAATAEFGKLDVLFNNAGVGGARETADGVTAEGFDSVMHLHVRAAMFGMKYATPAMRKAGGGSIISTASIAGLRTGFGPLLYSTAKAAVIHMTHAAAAQLGPENIRVNCICPGMIATNIFAASFGIPSQQAEPRIEALAEANRNTQPIPRGGRGSDIAEAALYLASDGSGFVNGHALVVDGGITLGVNETTRLAMFENVFSALGVPDEQIAAIFKPKKS
jgi:NAD(P)-dependent dehydrogenase (short-subunit alcohol dehydrogenase family)